MRRFRVLHAWLVLLLAAACGNKGSNSLPQPDPAPADNGGWISPAKLQDTNPDPAIVEVNLEARTGEVEYLAGKKTAVWTYNGTVPGPTLEAKVGDTIIVHFRNSLAETTSIHWHGLRVPNDMDGMTMIPAGGTFDYKFTLKDPGTYWYHSHVRTNDQVRRGLYGAIVVHGDGEPDLGAERLAILDDALLDANGALAQGDAMVPMNGLEGNVVLVNGLQKPAAELRPGEQQRWRFINAANARYFLLAVPGRKLTVVGSDGGLLSGPTQVNSLLLVPGERAEVLLSAADAPGEVDLKALAYDRGQHMAPTPADVDLLTLRTVAGDAVTPSAVPQTLRTIPTLLSSATTRTLTLAEAGDMMDPKFQINGESFPNVTPFNTTLGAIETWVIDNQSPMDHPFHLHGFSFQVLSPAEGVAAWRDTLNVPAYEKVKLAVSFDGFPGTWLFHCHILEHAERGMIGEVIVAP